MLQISLIITTYNNPKMLAAVFASLLGQSDQNFEVIIADDGSRKETAYLIQQAKRHFPNLQHVWQEDKGFRAAHIRNKAILAAKGDYIIFLDGDCLVREHFIRNHRTLAEKGWLVAGSRVLVSKRFTERLLHQPTLLPELNLANSFNWWRQKKINRWFTLLNLPLGILRKSFPQKWTGVKTCNLAVWRQDLLTVNGFDESYQGWGYEDSDLVVRLLHAKVRCKSGRFATTVFHLWHETNNRPEEESANLERLNQVIHSNNIYATQGLDQLGYRSRGQA